MTIPVPPGIPGGGPEDPNGKDNEHRVVIHSISDSTEREGRDEKTTGKTAVWDRLPPTELAKTLGPKPQEPGATKQSVNRIEDRQQAPDLKTPDLASLPEMQQTPPALARAEAARLKRPVQTPEIEIPKIASSPKSASRVPTLPQRSVTGKPSAELNVERQKLESGNSPHYREAGTADVVNTLPSAPNPQPVTSQPDPRRRGRQRLRSSQSIARADCRHDARANPGSDAEFAKQRRLCVSRARPDRRSPSGRALACARRSSAIRNDWIR